MTNKSRQLLPGWLVLLMVQVVWALPVGHGRAYQFAHSWLQRNNTPMDARLGSSVEFADAVEDPNGRTLYYVMHLDPEGFVVLSSDDEVEPVVAFSETGSYNPQEDGPLQSLLQKDMRGRLDMAERENRLTDRMSEKSLTPKQRIRRSFRRNNQRQWKRYAEGIEESQVQAEGDLQVAAAASIINDIRVAPLLQTAWGQSTAGGGYCYNYYTPNYDVCGCAATMMAQVMRYHSWPSSGVGVKSFTITVDDVSQSASTRGGDGSGGAYVWSQMPFVPTSAMTETQRQAIGALCYDAAVAIGTEFTALSSSAYMSKVDTAMTSVFKYANSIYCPTYSTADKMINANLDAKLPVMLGISGYVGGHAVVADGYGYYSGVLYHHLNLGWSNGQSSNTWYQLPTVETYYYDFNAVDTCIYNIYKSGTGEIISGRVVDGAGKPVSGLTVSAYRGTTLSAQATTDAAGIYALKNLTSGRSYQVIAGCYGTSRTVSTGTSSNGSTACGNVWGVDFTISPLTGDFDLDCQVSQSDLSLIMQAWLSQSGQAQYKAIYDISTVKDSKINLADLRVLSSVWLRQYP